jgi:pSer/pThr/pTyr-binding forkhead associated (FHA) protein/tetratricopeptide (TPR) repeat protein
MQKLLIEDDEGKTVVVPLIRDEITIGRQEGNTIRLSEQNVSRRHARLVRRQGALLLEDLSSYNGTKLNGAVLSASAPLKDGDVILIGDYRMAIKEERPSAALAVAAHAPVASAAASSPAQAGAAAPPAAEVQDAIEAQPTIPLHSLVDEGSALDSASRPPRLVIVGRFMAGREFMLDRPSLVIGRTSENDIVIEHKSISRHHARIVREGNQYYAVDLESANGVRVNGVDHDRVLLSPGDQIELGQVQLRFVTEEGGSEIEPRLGRLSKGKIFGIVGGGVVVVALVVAFALSGGRSRPRPAPPAPPIVAQPLPPPPPPPPPPQETLADLLAAAKAAQASEKWDEALVAANKAVAAAPDSSEAAELRKLAEDEKGNAERFAALKEATDKSNFEAVLRGAGEIPETSVYKERASVLEKSARAEYVKLHVDAASSKASVGACDEAKSEAELVLAVDRNNKTAHWIVGRCAVLAKKASPKPEVKKPAQTPKPVAAAQSKPGASLPGQVESSVDPDKLIQQAREAWLRGQYILAIDSARRALRAKPDLTSAYQIIAICSCSLHDSDAALRAYEKLDERNRQLVRSACQKNGISF